MARIYAYSVQPDDNDDGTLWEVTIQTEKNLYLIVDGITEQQALHVVTALQVMDEREKANV